MSVFVWMQIVEVNSGSEFPGKEYDEIYLTLLNVKH